MNTPLLHSELLADAGAEQYNVLDLLKKGTADLHQLIERRMPVFREDFDLEDYAQLVELFFGFQAPVEARLSKLAALRDARRGPAPHSQGTSPEYDVERPSRYGRTRGISLT